jgi:hypothetical protein
MLLARLCCEGTLISRLGKVVMDNRSLIKAAPVFFGLLLLMIHGPFPIHAGELPVKSSKLFSGSGACEECHAPNYPNLKAMMTPEGEDISPVTLWRPTMMANAAKDPYWQAKVSAEVEENPKLQGLIEDTCNTCHTPMGRIEAKLQGINSYSMKTALADELAMDGVSCTVCHQIHPRGLGNESSFSGQFTIQSDRLIYGPFQEPFAQPMKRHVNYTPVYSAHVQTSELCATCHTLFTPTVDEQGRAVGSFPEQVPYLEWKNSALASQGIQCQTCHMPSAETAVVISNMPPFLKARQPFAQHEFVGGNVFMQKMFLKHGMRIGINASSSETEGTILRSLDLLQKETATVSAQCEWNDSETLEVKVKVQNQAGHKFPTGFPSRRAWLMFRVTDSEGKASFASGVWDETGEIVGRTFDPESHHDVISQPDQVQIYESIMKDATGKMTTTLLKAAGYLKDNRIPPMGFVQSGPNFSLATAVVGVSSEDRDFNRSPNSEGSGADTVTYRVGTLKRGETYRLEVRLLYQSLSPSLARSLFQHKTPDVQLFREMYQEADLNPITISSLQQTIDGSSAKTHSNRLP